MKRKMIPDRFFSNDARVIARKLLGKIIVRRINGRIFKARIVETEAYFDERDPASRARQKGNLRKVMEEINGTILVYGVHNNWLMNIVTSDRGKAEAVLLRALEPLNFREKTSGPGLLTKALKIDKAFHNKHISENKDLWLEESEKTENFEIAENFRIGVKKDLKEKLRFYIKGNKFVSKR